MKFSYRTVYRICKNRKNIVSTIKGAKRVPTQYQATWLQYKKNIYILMV